MIFTLKAVYDQFENGKFNLAADKNRDFATSGVLPNHGAVAI